MEEKRKVERIRLHRNGSIQFVGAPGPIRCVVKNLSPAGAQLLVNSAAGIPSEFKLEVEGCHPLACFVRWRDRFRLGVMFLPPHEAEIET